MKFGVVAGASLGNSPTRVFVLECPHLVVKKTLLHSRLLV